MRTFGAVVRRMRQSGVPIRLAEARFTFRAFHLCALLKTLRARPRR